VLDLFVQETSERLDDGLIDDFARAAASTVIDDTTAPMARSRLLCSTAAAEACLVLVFNHLIIDQQGVDIFLADVADAYTSAMTGRPRQAGAAPRYADHAWRSARLADDHRSAIDYWRRRLENAPPELALPFTNVRPRERSFAGAAAEVRLGCGFTGPLAGLLQERKATTAGFFVAVLGAVLGRWTGQETIIVGVPSSRRRTRDDQAMVGFLIDTLPVRLDLAGLTTFDDLLRQARHRYAEALDHAGPSFDEIVTALAPPVPAQRSPVFQVWVNDLTAAAPAPDFAGLRARMVPPPAFAALFDLGLYLYRVEDELVLRLVHEVDLITYYSNTYHQVIDLWDRSSSMMLGAFKSIAKWR
jgi:hypothetical protein